MWYNETSVAEAVKLANDDAARILLARESVLSKWIPDVSSISRLILRHEWKPYESYVDSDGNWGLQLRTDDWIVRLAMRDDDTYAALHSIATQALYDQLATVDFMTNLLELVILDGKGHDDTH